MQCAARSAPDPAQPPCLAREDQLRAGPVHRGGQEAVVIERVEPGECSEPGRAGRLDGRAQTLDDRARRARARPLPPRTSYPPPLTSLFGPAALHSGHMLAHSAGTTWSFEPLQLVPVVVGAILYWKRARTLARKGTPVAEWRYFLFSLGLALVVVALVSPIATLGEEESFAFHMVQHLLLGDLAPLCIVAGLTGPLLRPILSFRAVARAAVPHAPVRVAADLGAQPRPLAPADVLGSRASAPGGARPRARMLLHRRCAHVGDRDRGAARPGVVRDRREDGVRRGRPGRLHGPRERLRLVGQPRSTPSTSTRHGPGGSPRPRTRESPAG